MKKLGLRSFCKRMKRVRVQREDSEEVLEGDFNTEITENGSGKED